MKSKLAIVISAFITVMILTVILGITSVISKGTTAVAASSQPSTFDATKEAQYQQLIAQANQTIQQANQEIASLQAQNQALANPTATAYAFSADQAATIATSATGGTPLQTPTLVNYTGNVAYEVVFSNGKVYVDANTGKILYNGVAAVVSTISSQQASQIAVNYTGNNLVVEVVSGLYNGSSAYRVTFQNGEIVYIDVYGSILAVQLPPASSGSSSSESEGGDD
jgi:uncharacterized membrane protein YkoI